MAVTLDTVTGQKTDSGSSFSFSHTVNGNCIDISAGILTTPTAPTITAVSYAGVSMLGDQQFDSQFVNASFDIHSYKFVKQNPATGSNTVSVTYSGSGEIDCIVTSWFGVTSLGTPASANGTAADASVTVTSQAGGVVVDHIFIGQPTLTKDASQTLANEQESINFSSSAGVSYESGSGSVVMNWTYGTGGNGNFWAYGGVALIGASPSFNVYPIRPRAFAPGLGR